MKMIKNGYKYFLEKTHIICILTYFMLYLSKYNFELCIILINSLRFHFVEYNILK